MKIWQIIQIAQNKAKQSKCRFRIAAIGLNYKDEIVAKATNRIGYCSVKGRGLHAEARLCKIAKRKGIKTIFICRISRTGKLLPIEPCKSCAAQAEKLGIKIIW